MTNAELAVLSLIAEQPRHGYDIEQVIEGRGMRNWTEIGFSSIYYLLSKLEKEKLIESRLEQPEGKGPARKVYSITAEGRKVHLEGVITALSTPQRGSAPFLLGLSNYPAVPRDKLLAALGRYADQIEESLVHMLERSKAQHPIPPYVEAMFDYSQVLAEAELDWVRRFTKEVQAGKI